MIRERLHRLRRINLTPIQFQFICSVVTCLLFNMAFVTLVFAGDRPSHIENTVFGLSALWIVSLSAIVLFIPFYLLNIVRLGAFFLMLTAAIANYFSNRFGVVADEITILSVFETTYGEASQYFNFHLFVSLFVWILVCACVAFLPNLQKENLKKRVLGSLKIVGVVAISLLFIGVFFYKDYASFLRNNREARHLVNPASPLYQIGKYWKNREFPKTKVFTIISDGAYKKRQKKRKRLVVFVLGETARADHFSLYGYTKNNTTPNLSHLPVAALPNVSSCGTATAVSVPCLFSNLGRDRFDNDTADSRENLLDVLQKAGYRVTWIDNNTGCQGVCDRINSLDIQKFRSPDLCAAGDCYDEILLHALKESVQKNEDQFVVLHMLGSHGPSYYRRYPKSFETFKPACSTSDLNSCSQEEIINTYDNTILYTDFVLSSAISYLKTLEKDLDVAMIYVSDHGESLGERGLYLHSLPYMLAPKEQKQVPLLFWFSKTLSKEYDVQKLIDIDTNVCGYSHDYIFSTVLNVTGVSTKIYNPQLDLFNLDTQLCKLKTKYSRVSKKQKER